MIGDGRKTLAETRAEKAKSVAESRAKKAADVGTTVVPITPAPIIEFNLDEAEVDDLPETTVRLAIAAPEVTVSVPDKAYQDKMKMIAKLTGYAEPEVKEIVALEVANKAQVIAAIAADHEAEDTEEPLNSTAEYERAIERFRADFEEVFRVSSICLEDSDELQDTFGEVETSIRKLKKFLDAKFEDFKWAPYEPELPARRGAFHAKQDDDEPMWRGVLPN